MGKISHVIIAFNANSGNFKHSTNDFTAGFVADNINETKNTTDAVSLIKSIQLKLGQSIYPQESYSLQTDNNGRFPNTNDLARCYMDYCVMTNSFTSYGTLLSYSQWVCQPIFVFKINQTQNDMSNIYSVRIDLNVALVVPTEVVILALYDTVLTLEYDAYARISSLSQMPVNPL